MATKTATTRPTTLVLPRAPKDTKNYARFEIVKDRSDPTVAPFGAVYVPLADAVGVTSVTVTIAKG